ncbi:MAG: hypothetical protein M3209_00375 [Acidobacteriota bacterium]|nr:hypothetical protein [Acidobacteriota bacterium]
MKIKFVLLSLILSVATVFGCQAQSKQVPSSIVEADCFKEHPNALDFYDSLKLRPVKVTSIEGSTVFYNYEEKLLIKPASVVITDKSELPSDFRTKHEKNRFFIVFCEKHLTAQLIQSIEKPRK